MKATGGLVQQRFGKSGGSVLRMTVFRKFEVCASYEHLWLNRHLRQAAKRCATFLNKLYLMTSFINKIWKDPVWSKVISVGIVFIITLLYNFIISLIKDISFQKSFFQFWNYPIKLWIYILFSFIIILSIFLIKRIISNKNIFNYDEDTIQLDSNLYLKIRDELLTDNMMMNVKQNLFSTQNFHGDYLFKILDLIEESQKSYFEFLNPILETKKNNLIETIKQLHNITALKISGVNGSPGFLAIPREWVHNDRERYDEAWKSISEIENKLSLEYDDFIRTGKRILKI